MSRKTLTANRRSFGNNPDTFPLESLLEPLTLTIEDQTTGEKTVVRIDPRTSQVTDRNGEDLGPGYRVERRIDDE